ncbi:MAG: DNA polymerase Y family protein [Planctomycetales bacterium]|nr:DNA polymerase Y family protein [Planctomycetales bacterium]
MNQRILCLWIPAWPIQRQVLQTAAYAGQALAVHAAPVGNAKRGRRILACSAAAAERGIRPDMPLVEATSLRRRGAAPLHLLPHDPAADLEQLAKVAEYCERFSPLVGWRTTADSHQAPPSGPDCLLLDVTRVERHFGGEQPMLRRVRAALGRRSLQVCLGLAGTIGAAWALAHFDDAGQIARPPHECSVPPGEEARALATRPPAALRLGDSILELLQRLGIDRCEQLAALPRSTISSRLGFDPLTRWDQAIGAAAETLLAHRPSPEFSLERRLDSPVHNVEALELCVSELVSELTERLRAARRGATQLHCRLDTIDGQATQLSVGLFEPSDDTEHLRDLLCLQLHTDRASIAGDPCEARSTARIADGVERLVLSAPHVAPLVRQQQELFGGQRDLRPAALLVDRLRQRLGEKCVLQAKLTADAQPERSFKYVWHYTGTQATRRRSGQSSAAPVGPTDVPPDAIAGPLHRPLLLAAPQELQVFKWSDQLPKEFSWNGSLVEVLRSWGPERIETGWWRGRSVRRDYYRVELRSGERLWLFRHIQTGQWFLHGWYG